MACQPACRHGFGVAAHTHGGFFFFGCVVRDVDELAAQGFNLLFHAGANVAGFNHSAQTFGGGDGLQTGNPYAQNHHARRFDRARRRHQHGKEPLVFVGRHHHGLIARNIGLARQHIHALRSCGARRGLQRVGSQACACQGFQAVGVKGVQHAHQSGAGFHGGQFCPIGAAHFEYQIACQSTCGVGNFSASRRHGCVNGAGGNACASLYAQGMAQGFEFFNGLWRGRHAGFARSSFQGNANQHGVLLNGIV